MPPRCSLCTPGQGRKTPSPRAVRTSLLKGGACVTIIVYPLYIHPLYTLYCRICTYMHPLYMCIPIGTPYIHLLHTSKHPIYTPHTPLHGSNFGPASLSRTSTGGVTTTVPLSSISKVTYGKSGVEYEVPVAKCSITKDHFFVTCKTVPGAGKGLKWFINIDGQESITPSTYFGAPEITSITGPTKLSTSGKETITICEA